MKVSPGGQTAASRRVGVVQGKRFSLESVCRLQTDPDERIVQTGCAAVPGFVRVQWRPNGLGVVASGPETNLAAPGPEETRFMAELTSRVLKAVRTAPLVIDPNRIVLSISEGRLGGVTCLLSVTNKTVRCKLRAEGAVLRKCLARCRAVVASALSTGGFHLDGFEVSR